MWQLLAAVIALPALFAFWWHIKVVVSATMVAMRVDWPNMPDGDKLDAAIGLVVGVASLRGSSFTGSPPSSGGRSSSS